MFPPRPPVKAIRFSIRDSAPVAFSFPGASRRGFAGRLGAATALNVHATAMANLANLDPFGVTAAKLDALKTRIDACSASMTKPREAVATGSTATQQMGGEFDAADAALDHEMDALVPQFAATAASGLLGFLPSQFVRPRFGFAASARLWMTSAAVCPCTAQCILFCTVAKKSCDVSTRGS